MQMKANKIRTKNEKQKRKNTKNTKNTNTTATKTTTATNKYIKVNRKFAQFFFFCGILRSFRLFP